MVRRRRRAVEEMRHHQRCDVVIRGKGIRRRADPAIVPEKVKTVIHWPSLRVFDTGGHTPVPCQAEGNFGLPRHSFAESAAARGAYLFSRPAALELPRKGVDVVSRVRTVAFLGIDALEVEAQVTITS